MRYRDVERYIWPLIAHERPQSVSGVNGPDRYPGTNSRRMSTLALPFTFVIGAPRSGTTWLHQMLSEHPAVAGLGSTELTLFSRYLSPWAKNFKSERQDIDAGRWSQGLPVLFSDDEFEQLMRSVVDDVYSRVLARRPGASHLLDKHPNYSNHLPLIHRLLPQSRFVHIIRDGREVAVSMMSAAKRVGHSPGEIRGAAQEWVRCITNARAYGSTLGRGQYLEVRYEDLMAGTAAQVQRVFAFCELEATPAFVEQIAAKNNINVRQVSGGDSSLNKLRSTPGAIWKQKLATAERYAFDRIGGGLLRELGYAEKDWWILQPSDRLRGAQHDLLFRMRQSASVLKNIWTRPYGAPIP